MHAALSSFIFGFNTLPLLSGFVWPNEELQYDHLAIIKVTSPAQEKLHGCHSVSVAIMRGIGKSVQTTPKQNTT